MQWLSIKSETSERTSVAGFRTERDIQPQQISDKSKEGGVHHRDTESTEITRRLESILSVLPLCSLCLCVSVVRCDLPLIQLVTDRVSISDVPLLTSTALSRCP
jgi:hypothetical protein